MDSTWTPYDSTYFMWSLYGVHVEFIWSPCGVYLEYVEFIWSMWSPHGGVGECKIQEILEQEYQEEMREAREARREVMGTIGEVEEIDYEQQEGLVSGIQVGTHLPMHNYEQGPPGDWADDQDEVPPRLPIPTTYHEPVYDVYEAYGTADEPPDAATSLGHDAWPDVDTTPLEYEHLLLRYGM